MSDINQKTLRGIVKNTTAAKEVWENFPADDSFKQCFHLRPTSSGITIISTLPYAPMRGKSVRTSEELEAALRELKNALKKIRSVSATSLTDYLFKQRGGSGTLEESVQANFIRGMLSMQPQYEGIQFVASELTLGCGKRFDVVGYKEDTLYVFELKKGRTLAASEQIEDYLNFVRTHKEAFLQVLRNYPTFPVANFSNVKGVCVMAYAYNATRALQTPANVDLWRYEQSLSFVK